MHKTLLLSMVLGSVLSACSGLNATVSTATTVPSSTLAPTMSTPALIREIDLETQTGTAYTLDWSPDGEILAVASGYEITLLGSDLKEKIVALRPEGGALGISWNPDQTKFATVNGYRNPTLELWEWDRDKLKLNRSSEIQAGSDQYGVFWSSDGRLLATLADDDKTTFQIWDVSTGEELHKYELPHANPLRTSSWSADSATLYAAGEAGGQIVVFELNVGDGSVRVLAKFPGSQAAAFAFSPDEKTIAVSDPQGVVQFLDVASGEFMTEIKSVDQPVDLAWNPDGSTLAILDYKTKLQLWDVSD